MQTPDSDSATDGESSDSLAGPPDFARARNKRQKVRAAGMNPDYWYAVEYDSKVKRGQVVEVKFWKRSIALFRGDDGQLRAIENRCAHRQLKLSVGHVEGCKVVCPYHGWKYDGTGRCVEIPHELFGRQMPSFQLQSFPVKVRYGLIFIFPGDPALSTVRTIPDIPQLEGPNAWACVPIDATWRAHHSMILDNVSDFTHAYLHRRYKPFWNARLLHHEAQGDRVFVKYETEVGGGLGATMFDRKNVNMSAMELCYEYPYQWSNTDDTIRHWLFVLPVDERTTRGFFLFHFSKVRFPLTRVLIPKRLLQLVLHAANRFHIKPLLDEDGMAVEAEQQGYDEHFDQPIAELNPAVNLFQALTIRKWEEHLQKAAQAPQRAGGKAGKGARAGQGIVRLPVEQPGEAPPTHAGADAE